MQYIPKHFIVEEFFPYQVIAKYGEDKCWEFMDERVLKFMDWIREELDRPIIINNYKWGGKFSYRGFRPNTYKKSRLYCSQHCFGRAIDFDVEGMTSDEVRKWLKTHINDLPFNIWVEDKVNWVHIDVRYSNKGKLYFFNI